MARQVIETVEFIDDLDGSKADRTISFGYDGKNYEIDLSKKNAAALERAVRDYVRAARKVRASRARGATGSRSSAKRTDLNAIRVWARSQGHEVSDRGRIPVTIVDAYDQAH